MTKRRKINLLLLGIICMLMVVPYMATVANDVANPISFPLDGTYRVYQMGEDKVCWFKFVIPSDGKMEFRIQNYCTSSLSYVVYSEDQLTKYFSGCGHSVSAAESAGTPTTKADSDYLGAGTYLLKITCSVTGHFNLFGSFEAIGANDAGANSYLSPCSYSVGTTVTGVLVYTGDDKENDADWFVTSLSGSKKYTLNVRNYTSSSMSYEIWNSDKSKKEYSGSVSSLYQGAPGSKTVDVTVSGGTYYLKFYGTKGKYQFWVTGSGATGNSTKAAKTELNGMDVSSAQTAVAKITGNDDFYGSNYCLLQARLAKSTKSTIRLKWRSVGGSSRYVVYGARCGYGYKQLASTTSTTAMIYSLEKGRYYKFVVAAVRSDNSIITTSKTVHACTAGGRYCNTGKVKFTKGGSSRKLSVGKSFKLKAKYTKASSKRKLKSYRKMRYESSNTDVATVTGSGKVKAVGKGTCYIFAFAQDGRCRRCKVKVS